MRAAQVVSAGRLPLRTVGRQQPKQFGNGECGSVPIDQLGQLIATGAVAAIAGHRQGLRAAGDVGERQEATRGRIGSILHPG